MIKRVFFTQYTNVPPSVPEVNEHESMTWQHCKDECDILKIVKKPNLGVNPLQPPTTKPSFGDFSDSKSFQEAQNLLIEAQQQFADMPSAIRDRFNNDPYQMLQFVENPDNIDECIKLGIFEKKVEDLNHHSTLVGEPEKAGPVPTPTPAVESSAHTTT